MCNQSRRKSSKSPPLTEPTDETSVDNSGVDRLLGIMQHLRDPETGCPWDLEQDLKSLVPHTLEETYEVEDAIQHCNFEELREELGDLLFQVIFFARLAQEAGHFRFQDIVDTICDKLIRRHPNIFGENPEEFEPRLTSQDQIRLWEQIKTSERSAKAAMHGLKESTFDDIPKTLPSLMRTTKLLRRATDVFEADPETLLEQIRRNVETFSQPTSQRAQLRSLGDLLFNIVHLSALFDHDAESALREINTQFERKYERGHSTDSG